MTFGSSVTLFGAMVVLALVPSISVLAVTTRSAASGFVHGVSTTAGIVVGDVFFIILAIFGLSVLADTLGSLFVLVNYLGGTYLIWLGITLWRSRPEAVEEGGVTESSLWSSFLAGLFITLGDQKAILFYLVFFPAFVDLSALSYLDAGLIILIAIIAVGGVKLAYAFMADRARLLFKRSDAIKRINIAAGTIMIVVGMFLLAKA
jgi:threonine/homoserine/homoserine lactone efflux protein